MLATVGTPHVVEMLVLIKQVIGVQHHKLAQILLSIFDPRIPKVGGNRSIAVRAMEAEIKPNLLELCGIGLYNRWTPPGMFTASMGIAICELFSFPGETLADNTL